MLKINLDGDSYEFDAGLVVGFNERSPTYIGKAPSMYAITIAKNIIDKHFNQIYSEMTDKQKEITEGLLNTEVFDDE